MQTDMAASLTVIITPGMAEHIQPPAGTEVILRRRYMAITPMQAGGLTAGARRFGCCSLHVALAARAQRMPQSHSSPGAATEHRSDGSFYVALLEEVPA